MKVSLKIFLFVALSLFSVDIMSQGVKVFTKDGNIHDFPYESLDSIVVYNGSASETAPSTCADVAFATSNEEIELEPTAETTHTFYITRTNVVGEVVVPFVVEENTDDVFQIGEAKFAAGDSVAACTVTFPNAEVGVPYTLRLTVSDPNFVSDYSKGTIYSLTVIRVKWNPAGYVVLDGKKYDGYAMYTDDVITGLFNAPTADYPYPVMLQERDDKPGYFRMINPYGQGFPFNQEGDYDPTVDSYVFIDATNPSKVYIPQRCVQATDWGYGNFIIFSLAGYYLERGDAGAAAPYFGKYENGEITFPAGALLFGMTGYNDGGLYTANNNGAYSLVINPELAVKAYEANLDTDFEWEALYTGNFVSSQLHGQGSATLYKGTCTVNTDDCDKVFAETYGTPYYIEAPYAKGANLYFGVNAEGKVTILKDKAVQATGMTSMGAAVYAVINAKESSFTESVVSLNITFQNEDGSVVYGTANETLSNITYSPVGIGTYTFAGLLKQPTPVDGFILSKRDDKEDVYMIEQWFGPFGGTANLTFTWNKKDNTCTVPTQTTSMDLGNGEVFISDLAYYTGNPAAYASYPCTFDPATNTFSFTVIYHIASGGYYNDPIAETFVVEFDETSGAKVVKQSMNKWDLIMGTPKNGKNMKWKNPFGNAQKVNFKSVKAVDGPVF